MRHSSLLALAILVLACTAPARADHMGGPGGGPGGIMGGPPGGPPAFLSQVFSPKLVMEHQQEIDLKPGQADAIKQAMLETQKQLLDLQWQLDAESEALGKLLAADHVDEKAVLEKLDRVTEIEKQVKKTNFALLVRIKNQLDGEQQKKLRTYRRNGPPGPPGGPPGGPPAPPP
jgi:Spy/CpxP family protein refolding chaperone